MVNYILMRQAVALTREKWPSSEGSDVRRDASHVLEVAYAKSVHQKMRRESRVQFSLPEAIYGLIPGLPRSRSGLGRAT